MQNNKQKDFVSNRIQTKRKTQTKQNKQTKRSQLTQESYIIDANKTPSRNTKGELMITYEKLQDDIIFDIDLECLHQMGAKNMVLIERSQTPTNN